MDYAKIQANIENGKYDTKLPYPPFRGNDDLPIKQAAIRVEKDKEMKAAYREDCRRLENVFKEDVRQFAEGFLDMKLTNAQFEAVFSKAWGDGHSAGYSEVLIYADDLLQVIKEFV